jgi:hypothetical protein
MDFGTLSCMSVEPWFYMVPAEQATVYVDTQNWVQAGKLALKVYAQAGFVPQGWQAQPVKSGRDRTSLGAPKKEDGVDYWIVPKAQR